jgi:hypothetical protein
MWEPQARLGRVAQLSLFAERNSDFAAPPRYGTVMSESSLVPIEVTDRRTIDEICRFRVRVWEATGCLAANAFPDGIWRDEWDDICAHWAVMSGGGILAAARWSVHESLEAIPEAEQYRHLDLRLQGPIATAGRIVVSPAIPHLSLAWDLLDALERRSRLAGARYGIGQASPAMVRILQRRGLRIVGPAAPDARFPGVLFQVAIRDFSRS